MRPLFAIAITLLSVAAVLTVVSAENKRSPTYMKTAQKQDTIYVYDAERLLDTLNKIEKQ